MDMLRTPDERFADLPGWPYPPQWLEPAGALEAGQRMHYIDEGPRDAAVTVLCLHGNPTWSYLYRHMIPVFTGAGLRVVAPDLIGFGRSDKPTDEAWHQFDRHRQSLLKLIETLDLRNVMLVCQDWGGIFGLTLPMASNRSSRSGSRQMAQSMLFWSSHSTACFESPGSMASCTLGNDF